MSVFRQFRDCFTLCVAGMVLASCSTSVKVTPVVSLETAKGSPGAYYALPKTAIDIAIEATVSKSQDGPYSGNPDISECLKKCNCAYAEGEKQYSVKTKTVAVTGRAVPDLDQLYRVELETASPLVSATHKMTFNEALALTKGSVETIDQTSDIAFDIFGKVLNAAASGAVMAPEITAPKASQPASCATPNGLKLMHVRHRLGLPRLDADGKTLVFPGGTLTKEVDALKDAKSRIVCGGNALKSCVLRSVDGPALTAALQYFDTQLAALETERKGLVSLFTTENAADDTDVTLKGTISPDVLKASTINNEVAVSWFGGTKAQNVVSRAGYKATLKLAPAIASPLPSSAIATTPPSAASNSSADMGYRYRIPLFSDVVISDASGDISSTPVAVAQLGVVTGLPATYPGKGSAVTLELFELTGSPKSLEVGNTAIDSAKITGTIDSALTARKDAQKAADDAATALKPVNQLKAEKDELSALDDVCKLRAKVGKPAGTECEGWKPQ